MNGVDFKDHFSRQASDYAQFRPRYPRELFAFIAAQTPNDELALDCATGNGQAALALAEFFQKVIALDASAAQIASALPNDRVEYRVAPAEATGLPDHSCAALTVAQAMHWLDLDAFYAEARRVLMPRGVLAFWAYNYLRINSVIETILKRYHDDVVGPYWPPERKTVGRGYLELPFPFEEIAHPDFEIEAHWTLDHLLGYLRSWSATQRYLAAKKSDPLGRIRRDLAQAWGEPAEERLVLWPLTLRIGRA
jgi:SAM-dependent methyltransferase